MNVIETTTIFDEWLDNLKDLRAKVQIATRIEELKMVILAIINYSPILAVFMK